MLFKLAYLQNWQSYLYNLRVYVTQLINFMHEFVDIDTVVLRGHLVITVSAGIQQDLVLLGKNSTIGKMDNDSQP